MSNTIHEYQHIAHHRYQTINGTRVYTNVKRDPFNLMFRRKSITSDRAETVCPSCNLVFSGRTCLECA